MLCPNCGEQLNRRCMARATCRCGQLAVVDGHYYQRVDVEATWKPDLLGEMIKKLEATPSALPEAHLTQAFVDAMLEES